MGIFPDAQGQLTLQSLVRSGRISNLSEILWLSLLPAKNEEDPIKNEGARVIIIIIIIMTLFKEEAQLDKVQSSLRSSIKQHLHTFIQTYREFYNNY